MAACHLHVWEWLSCYRNGCCFCRGIACFCSGRQLSRVCQAGEQASIGFQWWSMLDSICMGLLCETGCCEYCCGAMFCLVSKGVHSACRLRCHDCRFEGPVIGLWLLVVVLALQKVIKPYRTCPGGLGSWATVPCVIHTAPQQACCHAHVCVVQWFAVAAELRWVRHTQLGQSRWGVSCNTHCCCAGLGSHSDKPVCACAPQWQQIHFRCMWGPTRVASLWHHGVFRLSIRNFEGVTETVSQLPR
jgi:hypothetical protein